MMCSWKLLKCIVKRCIWCEIKFCGKKRVGLLGQFPPMCYFPDFHDYHHGYLLNSTFILNMCRRIWQISMCFEGINEHICKISQPKTTEISTNIALVTTPVLWSCGAFLVDRQWTCWKANVTRVVGDMRYNDAHVTSWCLYGYFHDHQKPSTYIDQDISNWNDKHETWEMMAWYESKVKSYGITRYCEVFSKMITLGRIKRCAGGRKCLPRLIKPNDDMNWLRLTCIWLKYRTRLNIIPSIGWRVTCV